MNVVILTYVGSGTEGTGFLGGAGAVTAFLGGSGTGFPWTGGDGLETGFPWVGSAESGLDLKTSALCPT